ncbi:MFS general substrate transporter [Stereum hirsutum FP-91666 SS1]|uniref:MFS general substrate transporter n=1 Tax=Stereum hirsutum (strain FP-91666) TaxID=721885 RepID=UPI000440F71D|nr:MFS general substrate transporter [Stereum hirsutum FP-91666 SS1]EIM91357.1 MFS general substrate transporter [Stereum hirsutum FP-91666 SS1]
MADEKVSAADDKEVFTVLSSAIKLDSHGLPLSPQPSDDPEDPLNWPLAYRLFVLLQVGLLATLGNFNVSAINPASSQLAEEFGISTVTASYQTTAALAMNGLGPFLFLPIANAWGRRPVYLFTTFIGFCSALGAAYAQSYPQLIGARIVNGSFPVAMSLGVGTITDIFFLHQRGRAMGFFTMMLTNGSHVALIIGGVMGQFLSWRWIFKIAAIGDGFLFLLLLLFLPETLYKRLDPPSTSSEENHQYAIVKCYYFFMLNSVDHDSTVLAPQSADTYCLTPWYRRSYSLLPAITGPTIFLRAFGWKSLQIGLATGGALTSGSFLGELAGGWVVDSVMTKARQRHGEDAPSEARLKAVWTGEILVPAGLLIFGFCLQYGSAWQGPILGTVISAFGTQCITTVMYTYSSDCYREQSTEVAQVFNFFRQEIGVTFAFYAVPLATAMGGYQWLFIFFSGIGSVIAFLPIVYLMYQGTAMRARMG